MKKRNWIWMLLILLAMGAFLGYQALDAMRTDTRPPEIRMDGTVPSVSVKDPKSAMTAGITATDWEDGDVTESLVVKISRCSAATAPCPYPMRPLTLREMWPRGSGR